MSGRKPVYLSQLRDIEILWPGDVFALGEFVLRSYDARDAQYNAAGNNSIRKSRPALRGLVAIFGSIADMPRSQIEDELKKHSLDLGASVEFD